MAAPARREPGLDFDRAIAMAEHQPTPRFVVANMNSWNYSKSAFMHAHDPTEERKASISSVDLRPRTSHGILNRPRRQSFSRPLTSDGPGRLTDLPPTPPIPANLVALKGMDTHPASIGVALGSPAVLAPSISLSGPLSAPFEPTSKPPTPSIKAQPNEENPKMRRWKSVGALFRKKSSPQVPPEPSRKAKAPPKPKDPSPDPPRPRSASRRRSFAQSLRPKLKADEPPPVPVPSAPGTASSTNSVRSSPHSASSAANHPHARVLPPTQERAASKDSPRSSPDSSLFKPASPMLARATTLSPTSKPTLDVDIPQFKMDRYSVMFSELLSEPVAGDEPETTSIQTRRQPNAEKLAPLKMNRISSSPTFVQEPLTAKSAPPFETLAPANRPPSLLTGMPRPSERRSSLHSANRSAAYSLFPRTDTSPPVPTTWSLEVPDHDYDFYNAAPTLNVPHDGQANHTTDDARPLRSSSLFAPEPTLEQDRDDVHSRPSTRQDLYPPSPPLSSLDSPFAPTNPSQPSPTFRSARSSWDSFGLEPSRTHTRNESGVLGGLDATFHPSVPSGSPRVGESSRSKAPYLSPSIQPVIGMAHPVRLSYKHEKPRFLNTPTSPSPTAESHDNFAEGRSNARTPTFVHIDSRASLEDEEAWVRRRSMWGVLDDA